MKTDGTRATGILYLPLTRILVGLMGCVLLFSVVQWCIKKLLDMTSWSEDIKGLVGVVVLATLTLIGYTLLYRAYEKRQITELSSQGIARNLLIGAVLGAVLQSLTIYVIYLNHGFTIVSVNPFGFVLPALGMSFGAAIMEEVLFRGIIFRITESSLGSYWALAISALIFGAAHLANPNSTLIAAMGIAIQAGLLLGAAYIYSRNLWLPIALHFAWDFTQSGIFGATMSGNAITKSWLTTKIQGPSFISGGSFGPEGSVQATVFCAIAALILMIINHRQHKIIPQSVSSKIKTSSTDL
jgi:uncharacterized protein